MENETKKEMTEKYLILRCCKADGTSYNGFQWPLEIGARVEAPDWDPAPMCGNGLHGWLDGRGDLSENMQATFKWLREEGFMVEEQTVSILSIDAWRGGDGWTWNQWWCVGEIDMTTLDNLKTNRQILAWMRREGYLSDYSAERVTVEDDQYNIVICERATMMPVFAIVYGEASNA